MHLVERRADRRERVEGPGDDRRTQVVRAEERRVRVVVGRLDDHSADVHPEPSRGADHAAP
ncbi:hypothetical protein ACWER9_16135 [Micromonospora sp. NPDC003944]